jgi:O-antigen/teichoic acid export membrane protein
VLWSDTLLLGYFKTPDVVGLYNAASPLAKFVSEPLALMMLIYIPVATGLYSQNLMAEFRRSYIISTKWIVSLTLPFFLVLFLFPEGVLNLLFGPSYVAAAPALRILSLGFIIGNLLGPRIAALVALGKVRFVFWVSLSLTALYLLLNIVLIPPLGIVGAAIASALSLTLGSIITAAKVYSLCRVQPLSNNLLKPIAASIVLALVFKFATYGIVSISWWMLILFFILYYAIYGIAIVLTRSFDREDIALLLEIEKMSNINAEPVKKILRRFL